MRRRAGAAGVAIAGHAVSARINTAGTMLSIQNLSKTYNVNGQCLEAVKPFSMDIAPGKVYCFLGPNGAGKTTTIKMLCGLVSPTTGTIIYNGRDMIGGSWVSRPKTGAVLEGARNINWRLTVPENINYFCGLHGINGHKLRSEQYMRMLGLEEYKNTECRYLSRGNQQKVALACALTLDAEILLLDEPTLGLDIETARSIMEVVNHEKSKNRITIVTTHDTEFIELAADEVVLFKNGILNPIGTPQEIVAKHGNGDNRFSTAYLQLLRS